MRKSAFSITLLLATAMVFLAGCDPTLDVSGRKVRFTAVSKAAPTTKTVYIGQPSGGWQTIGWVTGNTPDKIRIYCPKEEDGVFSYFDGTATWTETDQVFSLDYVYADYSLKNVSNTGHESNASLENVDGNGLIWNGADNATFYAAYPHNTAICSNTSNQLRFALQIPAAQTGDPADVADMPLLAIQKDVAGGSDVHLDFYPAFSAYEFHLKSADDTKLTIDSFELSSASTDTKMWLTGTCYYDLNRLSNTDMVVEDDTHFLNNSALDFDSDCARSITINVGQEISRTTEAAFTIFALPCAIDQMSIRVTFTPEGGEQTTRSLKLKKNDNWITFPAGHKALITGMAVEAGKKWELTVKTDVNDWIYIKETTTFTEQIGILKDNDPITGETETGPKYADSKGVIGGTTGYAKYYQIRTLDMAPTNPHFVMKFTPFAPLGGYWKLIPEGIGAGSLQHFSVRVYLGEGEYSDDLTGQIMGQEVEIHIFPKDFDPEAGASYAMIMKCFVSSQKDFDEAINADSEFQDVHGDGRYSYWRFTLPSSN